MAEDTDERLARADRIIRAQTENQEMMLSIVSDFRERLDILEGRPAVDYEARIRDLESVLFYLYQHLHRNPEFAELWRRAGIVRPPPKQKPREERKRPFTIEA